MEKMTSETSTTCLVTVTYGNRGGLVVKVLEAAVSCGIDSVVVIDNGATPESMALIRDYAESCNATIFIVSMGRNTGSAGGFKRGLEEAYRSGADFIWLLDDDNQPDVDALTSLKAAYGLMGNDPRVVLCSYRKDRLPYFRAVEYGEIPDIRKNSFLDFDLANKLGKLIKKGAEHRLVGSEEHCAFPLVLTKLAPYGGLYLHRSWIDKIGVPDESLFLYGDDHEYSLRFANAGGVVYVCAHSQITDIDPSWNEVASRVPSWVSKESAEVRVFYAIRNRVALEERFVTNKFIYALNACLYIFMISAVALVKYRSVGFLFKRLGLILSAIKFGMLSRKEGRPLGALEIN